MLCVIVKYIEAILTGDIKMQYSQNELNEILAKHKKWLNGEEGGERANLRSANLRHAYLSYADLRHADLRHADLSYADLSYADLRFLSSADGKVLACMNAGKYQVVISKEKIAIGCKFYTIEEWRGFDDERISRMDCGALEWWNQWKEVILMFHANVFC